MSNRSRISVVLLSVLLLSGCYHAVVRTGPPPGGAAQTHTIWANSFIAGLIPPPEVDGAALCGRSPSVVETQHTFVQALIAAVTFSLYTPMTIEVTCD